MSIQLCRCTGPGWDGVASLHGSPYGAVFWICVQNCAGNAAVGVLLGALRAFTTSPNLTGRAGDQMPFQQWGTDVQKAETI